MKQPRTSFFIKCILILGAALLLFFHFYLQRQFSFMLEDLDYLKVMSTGEELKGLGGIIRSQWYCFLYKGGSVLAGTLLQLQLLLGERFADICNIIVIALISLLICLAIGARHQRIFFVFLPMVLMISLNDDWQYSYCWQFAMTKFVYPAVLFLILLGILNYGADHPRDAFDELFLKVGPIVGLLLGWYNGGYGLVVLSMIFILMHLNKLFVGKKNTRWLRLTALATAVGSGLFLSTPGNFSKTTTFSGEYLNIHIFPAIILTLFMFAVLMRAGGWLSLSQMMMMGGLAVSVVFRFAGEFLPFCGSSGVRICTLVLSITLCCSLIYRMNRLNSWFRLYGYLMAGFCWIYAMLIMAENYLGVM